MQNHFLAGYVVLRKQRNSGEGTLLDADIRSGRRVTFTKAGRKNRFTCMNMTARPAWPVNKEQEKKIDVLVLHIAKIHFVPKV